MPTYLAPTLSICSLTSGRTSVAVTAAPRRRAVAIACRPATPAPRTRTFAGGTVPAAVIIIGMKRPRGSGGVGAGLVLGGDEQGLVAGDVGLRGERVHRLRPGDPRDRLHREGGHAGVGERA